MCYNYIILKSHRIFSVLLSITSNTLIKFKIDPTHKYSVSITIFLLSCFIFYVILVDPPLAQDVKINCRIQTKTTHTIGR